jgi:integrase
MPTVADTVAAFLAWTAEHRAPATRRYYARTLDPFAAAFPDRTPADLGPLEIEDWLRRAGRRPDGFLYAPDTRRGQAIVWLRWQSWCLERRLLPEPILKRIEKPRPKLRERIPTQGEIAAVLARASPAFGLIYRALLRSGARPGELAAARIRDWDQAGQRIVLAEHKTARKTGKPRVIPVGPTLAALLRQAKGGRTDGPLFLGPHGGAWTSRTLSATFRYVRKKAGLKPDLVLYQTRHYAATKLCDTSGVHVAAAVLGHASLRTTERYLHTTADQLAAAQETIPPHPGQPAPLTTRKNAKR